MRQPGVNATRLCERLMALAKIGATPGGGVNRQALSPGEIAAWRLVIGWAREAGLEAATDEAGNLFLTLRGTRPGLPPILSGSHLDTQPTGGRFDGAFGVMAALEVATTLAEQGRLPNDVIAVAWMNEEGSRFAPGMMGSEAFAGVRDIEEIRAARDADGITVASALDALHGAFPDLPRLPLGFPVAAYVEAHIEQGPVLEAHERVIGVVTAIQGKKTYEIVVSGEKGHAGTLAMVDRHDALASFARIAAAMHAEIGTHDAQVKFTIGRVRIEPNAPSVVPERAIFSIDLRHPDNQVLNMLGERIPLICAREQGTCTVQVKPLVDAPSNEFDAALQDTIEQAAIAFGYPNMRLLSAAGHDARHLAPLCPSAMIFIPCRGGVSHAEHEWAEPAHVVAGAEVLLAALKTLAKPA